MRDRLFAGSTRFTVGRQGQEISNSYFLGQRWVGSTAHTAEASDVDPNKRDGSVVESSDSSPSRKLSGASQTVNVLYSIAGRFRVAQMRERRIMALKLPQASPTAKVHCCERARLVTVDKQLRIECKVRLRLIQVM